jgi:hypothetical protein
MAGVKAERSWKDRKPSFFGIVPSSKSGQLPGTEGRLDPKKARIPISDHLVEHPRGILLVEDRPLTKKGSPFLEAPTRLLVAPGGDPN